MIRRIQLMNFKCFQHAEIEFRNLTILSGLNGVGKSSVVQSLLLLRQSFQQGLLPAVGLALNGDLCQIGTARDALFEGATSEKIEIAMSLHPNLEVNWSFDYDREADVLKQSMPPPDGIVYQSSLFTDDFRYLQAERLGPRTSFPMSDFLVRQHKQLGSTGEFTAHFLQLFGNKATAVPQALHAGARSNLLRDQVEAWLGEVTPGARIHLQPNTSMDLVSLQYSFAAGGQVSNQYRPTNVGFGLSYTVPVIVALLASDEGSLVIIENPEAHLHPRGQARLGELLVKVAKSGAQVIVETHSDHVLNGVRIAIRKRLAEPQDVACVFFKRAQSVGGGNQPVPLSIDSSGRISSWPEDFFDEWDRSLSELL